MNSLYSSSGKIKKYLPPSMIVIYKLHDMRILVHSAGLCSCQMRAHSSGAVDHFLSC